MSNSEQNSKPDGEIAALKEATSPYALDLPVAPEWWSRAPAGTWEDGYRLSLAALQTVKNRPEIFAQRDARMCTVEFEM